jgi:hypothetical protein
MSVVTKAGFRLALVALFGTTSSLAADERVTAALVWQRAAQAQECLDSSVLAAAVEEGLHRTVFVPAARADLIIEVRLDRPAQGQWSAAVDLEDPRGNKLGHRELEIRAQQCSAINEPLALVVSLMVDVTRESVGAQTSLVQPPPRNASQFSPESRELEPVDVWRKRIYLLGGARIGQLPGIGRGLGLTGELGPARGWLVALGVTVWVPAQMHSESSGAKFWLGTAEASLCATPAWHPRYEVSLCIGQQLGWLDSRAFGFDLNRTSTAMFYDLTFRVRTTWWATSSLGLHLGLGAGIPLFQDDFFATRSDGSRVSLLARPGLVPLADFGLGWRFGP